MPMSIDSFCLLLASMPGRVEEAQHHALERIGEHVAQTAKDMLGHDQEGWAELAEYTLAEKARLSLPSPSPLLRTGEHIRDTIEHHVSGHAVEIGSDDQVAVWQEEGTSRMQPRPYLKTAAIRDEDMITKTLGDAIHKALNSL